MSFRPGALDRAPPAVSPADAGILLGPGLGSGWRGAVARSRIGRAVARPWAGQATCLMYHRVCPDETRFDELSPGFAPNRDLSVTVSAFDRQMAFIARHFNCLALPEAVTLLAKGRLPRRSLVVTFDDGYLDNLTLALPVLRRHGVPATVYVATGLLGQDRLPWWFELEQIIARAYGFAFRWNDQNLHFSAIDAAAKAQTFAVMNAMLKQMAPAQQSRFMALLRQRSVRPLAHEDLFVNRRQLAELAADPLITIGAHTHHHPALSCLDPIWLRHELSRSKTLLETWLQRPVEHLAYPFGGQEHASTREFEAAAELNFASAVTTRIGHFHGFHARHLLALPRIGIDYRDCMARFEWKISGLYSLVRRPQSRVTC